MARSKVCRGDNSGDEHGFTPDVKIQRFESWTTGGDGEGDASVVLLKLSSDELTLGEWFKELISSADE